jgi:hypothetical protein
MDGLVMLPSPNTSLQQPPKPILPGEDHEGLGGEELEEEIVVVAVEAEALSDVIIVYWPKNCTNDVYACKRIMNMPVWFLNKIKIKIKLNKTKM